MTHPVPAMANEIHEGDIIVADGGRWPVLASLQGKGSDTVSLKLALPSGATTWLNWDEDAVLQVERRPPIEEDSTYPRAIWRRETEHENTSLSYWRWVASQHETAMYVALTCADVEEEPDGTG